MLEGETRAATAAMRAAFVAKETRARQSFERRTEPRCAIGGGPWLPQRAGSVAGAASAARAKYTCDCGFVTWDAGALFDHTYACPGAGSERRGP